MLVTRDPETGAFDGFHEGMSMTDLDGVQHPWVVVVAWDHQTQVKNGIYDVIFDEIPTDHRYVSGPTFEYDQNEHVVRGRYVTEPLIQPVIKVYTVETPQ